MTTKKPTTRSKKKKPELKLVPNVHRITPAKMKNLPTINFLDPNDGTSVMVIPLAPVVLYAQGKADLDEEIKRAIVCNWFEFHYSTEE